MSLGKANQDIVSVSELVYIIDRSMCCINFNQYPMTCPGFVDKPLLLWVLVDKPLIFLLFFAFFYFVNILLSFFHSFFLSFFLSLCLFSLFLSLFLSVFNHFFFPLFSFLHFCPYIFMVNHVADISTSTGLLHAQSAKHVE